MTKHLRDKHRWDPGSDSVAQKRQREGSDIVSAMARQNETIDEDSQSQFKLFAKENISKSTLEFLYLKWIITQDISFMQVEHHDFRTFLQYISPVANDMLPNSHSTITDRIMKLFFEGQQLIQLVLRRAVSDIHLTCDMWSSPNHKQFLAVLAHFTYERLRKRCILLGLKELQGAHTGENQARIVLRELEFYNFRDKLGYMVMDNATANDVLIRIVAKNLQTADNIQYKAERRRLRCNGHVINLAAQAFLFGKASDDLDYIEFSEADISLPTDAELNQWRKVGPLGKLHNIVVYICRTPQRRQVFHYWSDNLSLRRDDFTRWNSWYDMLDWALNRVREAIINFVFNEPELADDQLTAADWAFLSEIRDFLGPFKDATLSTEGRTGQTSKIEDVLISMDFLIHHFETVTAHYQERNNAYMVKSLDAGYSRLMHYYNKKDRTPAYIAAVVLNPEYKWEVFDQWEARDRKVGEKALITLWQEEYRGIAGLTRRQTPTIQPRNRFR